MECTCIVWYVLVVPAGRMYTVVQVHVGRRTTASVRDEGQVDQLQTQNIFEKYKQWDNEHKGPVLSGRDEHENAG